MLTGVTSLATAVAMLPVLAGVPPAGPPPLSTQDETTIIVRPPPTQSERRRALREFTRQILRSPRRDHPVAKFFYPVCPQVLGLPRSEAEAVAERIRENARALGVGADPDPGCVPTVRIAFMSARAGPPEKWLSPDSPMLAHLPLRDRERVLAESGPVRAWNRIAVRDYYGQPQVIGEQVVIDPPPKAASDPIVTAEITGAAIMIAREAAKGFTLAQLADYATVRTLIGTGSPASDSTVPARTILTLFTDPDPPAGLTSFDRALIAELYDASRNASARRVRNDIARAAARAEAAGQASE